MALKKVTGSKVAVDPRADARLSVDPPQIVIYDPARAYFKALALDLLGVTALTAPGRVKAVQEAADALSDTDEADWTQEDARTILNAVGSAPVPSHVRVWTLKGEATVLFKAVDPQSPGAHALLYPEGSRRPNLSLLAALRRQGISIPKGMAMDVPVKLVLDDDGLALAAVFSLGKLREVTEEEAENGTE